MNNDFFITTQQFFYLILILVLLIAILIFGSVLKNIIKARKVLESRQKEFSMGKFVQLEQYFFRFLPIAAFLVMILLKLKIDGNTIELSFTYTSENLVYLLISALIIFELIVLSKYIRLVKHYL